MGLMVKSSIVFSSAFNLRRMISSAFNSRMMMMSSSSNRDLDHFLVSRFSNETGNYYFSLVSAETRARVRDFHLPHFYGSTVKLSRSEGGLVHLRRALNDESLWNPWTNEFKIVPPSYGNKNYSVFGFDSISQEHYSFFGFDSKSQDYKIIRLVRNQYYGGFGYCSHYTVPHAELYSLRNDSWKEILDCPSLNYLRLYCYAAGCCYWVTLEGNIISFDFATEKFISFPLPKTTGWLDETKNLKGHFDVRLLEYDGLLGVLLSYVSKSYPEYDVELWVWNNGSWTRKFEFRLAGVSSGFLGFISSDYRSMFLKRNTGADNPLLRYDVHTRIMECKQLLRYDVHTQQVKKFDIYDFSPNEDMQVFPYFDCKVDFN